MTFDECCVACALKTGMSREDWADFFTLSPDAQQAVAETYRDASWVRSTPIFGEILGILTTAATIAGAASGIGGALNVLKTLI